MSLPPNFNRLARLYRWMELFSFGPCLMLCRCAFLNECLFSIRALVLGDGDGRFIARLLSKNPNIQIDTVDASSAMLKALVRGAIPHADRVRTFLADARNWQPVSPPYDLIVTHFFLDCLTTEEVKALATTLSSTVSSASFWVVSEFAIPTGWFGWIVARPTVVVLYRVFGWLTGLQVRNLPDHSIALQQAGFALEKRRRWLGGLLISELWSTTSCSARSGDLRSVGRQTNSSSVIFPSS